MKVEPQTEMTPVQGLTRLAALIYHYFAQEAVETLGPEKGRAMIAAAIHKMGVDRGRKVRQVVDAAGLEPTLDNMYKHYDLPIGEGWEASTEKEGNRQIETVTYCPMAEVWQEFDTEELDILYCDIDMAIIAGYNPDIEIERLESLLRSDGRCVYEYTMKDT